MKEDNLLNVYASKFIYESGLRDVALYGKRKGDWKCRLVDFDSAKHARFEWYYRDDLITTTYSYVSVLDDPNMVAFIKSMAKEMISQQKGDATHDKVYELNRQMCDIGKAILTKKKNDMEEKKTKKMTKAEAFNWLKGKRVACDSSNKEAVQRKFFKVGIRWRGGLTDVTDCAAFLFIDVNGCLTHCNSRIWFDLHEYEEISADDILSIEIVEAKSEEEDALDLISTVGARLSEVLRRMEGHKHIVITEDDVILYDEGMSLFHSDPF